MAGAPSLAEELRTRRLRGQDQFWSRVSARVEVQRSMTPGARLLDRIISKPSRRRIAVRVSRPNPCAGAGGELRAATGQPQLQSPCRLKVPRSALQGLTKMSETSAVPLLAFRAN